MSQSPERGYEETIIHEGADAITRLASMGLRAEYFDAAVRKGHDRASQVTRVHPRTYQGQVMWAETVAGLRTDLLNQNDGWDIGYTDHYETSFHPGRSIAIAVVGGDSNTGERTFKPPKAARKRGPVTEKRIRRNALGQMAFNLPGLEETPQDDELCDTWFFMLNARLDSMYQELSLATSLGPDGKFGMWRERILLPKLLLRGAVVTPIEPDDGQPPQVHVGRK